MLSTQPDAAQPENVEQQKEQKEQADTKAPPKPIFPSKHPLGKFQKAGQFRSPTDNLMSPATQKIEAKRGHLLNKINPKSLNAKLFEAAQKDNKQS